MKRITLLDLNKNRTRKTKRWLGLLTFCMMLFMGQMGLAQSIATQTFSANGNDSSSSTQLVITPSSITVNEGQPVQAVVITGFSGHYNSPTGSDGCWATSPGGYDWFSFNLNITGGTSNGTTLQDICSDSIIGLTVTDFTNITVSTNDTDNYSDMVYFFLTLEVTYETPSCLAPTALTASNPTLTSIDLSWDGVGGASGNYEIKWGAVGFDIDAATATPVTGLTYTLNGTGGNYEFVVREICSVNDASAWSSRKAFRIPSVGEDCSAPIVIGALPYTTTDDTA